MARLVYGMNVSLDGYVDHLSFGPDATLFRHFIDEAQGHAGSLYGRGLYELMRYWDDDHDEWDAAKRAFAAAWRRNPKWVVSTTLASVGPNAKLVANDVGKAVATLKSEVEGVIEVGGPRLAHALSEMGLIDEYRLYLHPVVLGGGAPFFVGPTPPLRLVSEERIGEGVLKLSYVPR